MTLTRKQFVFLTILFAAVILAGLLLLCGCGEKNAPQTEENSEYLFDTYGNWSTNGNLWFASSGNTWSTDGNCWYSYDYAYPQVDEVTGEVTLIPVYQDWVTDGNSYATYGNAVQVTPFATDGNAAPTNEVLVSNVDELLAAIAPDTRIVLAPGTYDLNAATPALYSYCYFRPLYDNQHELVICNVYNCIIEGQSGTATDALITQMYSSAAVLTFSQCSQIQLRNLALGHKTGAVCQGSVLRVENSTGFYGENCDFYGCGTWGLDATDSNAITLQSCHIHDCTYGAVSTICCESVLMKDCLFERIREYTLLNFHQSGWVELDNCTFRDIEADLFLSAELCYKLFLDGCSVERSTFTHLYCAVTAYTEPQINGCTFVANHVTAGELRSYGGYYAFDDSRSGGVIVDGELHTPDPAGSPYIPPVAEEGYPFSDIGGSEPYDESGEILMRLLTDFLSAYMKGDTTALAGMLSHPERVDQLGVWDGNEKVANVMGFRGIDACLALTEGQNDEVIITFTPDGWDSYLYMGVTLTRSGDFWCIERYVLDA